MIASRENYDLAPHFRCKLDGNVTKTTDTYNSHSVCRSDIIRIHRVEYRCSGTHQWRRVRGTDSIGNMEEESCLPHRMGSECTLVSVGVRISGPLRAEKLVRVEAFVTVPTRIVEESPASTIATIKTQHNQLRNGANNERVYTLNAVTCDPTCCTTPTPSWPRTMSFVL